MGQSDLEREFHAKMVEVSQAERAADVIRYDSRKCSQNSAALAQRIDCYSLVTHPIKGPRR